MGTRARFRGLGRLTLLLAATASMPALAAPPAPKPLACLIEPDRIADIGSQVVGLVDRIHVERGDVVTSGQPLLSLRADVERANIGVAERRAAIDADVRAADASLDLAQQKMRRAQALLAENFVSEQALDLARGEHELASQKLAQVRGQRDIWVQERRVAEAQLALRTLRSPFAGVVVDRYTNLGERVEEKPLLRVAVINPLRVELMVPTSQYGQVRRGDQLRIQPELPGSEAVMATVSHVDRVFDAASNSFRVRLTLPNPDYRLPAGLRCRTELNNVAAAGKASTAVNAAVTAPAAHRSAAPAR